MKLICPNDGTHLKPNEHCPTCGAMGHRNGNCTPEKDGHFVARPADRRRVLPRSGESDSSFTSRLALRESEA